MLKKFNQRGQVLVFYALMVPLLFLFIGAVADLGWYYLNKSRLQNAADAAVLAGAQAIVTDEGDFENYFVVSLAKDSLPADFDDYRDVFKNTFDSTTINTGTRFNYKKETDILNTLNTGRYWAETYMRKNLEDDKEVTTSTNNVYVISATDGWNASPNDSEKKVSGTLGLKYKIVDGKNDVYGPLYYVVNLQEKVRHFLLPNWFDPMNAEVTAVALLRPHHIGLITPIQQFERTKIIDNWEYANKYKGTESFYSGKWNHYQAGVKGQSNLGIRYESGNAYRKESVIVTPNRKTGGSVTTSAEGSSGYETDANGGNFYKENEVDSINIDFRAEVRGKFTSDWDLGYDFPEGGHSYQFMNNNSWSATDGADKRILFNTEFDQAFEARTDKIRGNAKPEDNKIADVLWVRIESDPLKNPYNGAGVSNFNSVRQITLNFNSDNTSVTSDSDGSYYEYRPYFIFYDGPENIDYKKDANGVLKRHSQPVVINLNEDLNAIIYTPNSPVIINGNGKTWHGFIIAKCFLHSVTEEDMLGRNKIWLWDGFNEKKQLECGFSKFTDGKGNTVYFKQDDLVTAEEIRNDYPDEEVYSITVDGNSNVLTVKEKPQAPKYILLNYTKADSQTYEVMTNGQHDENKTFAAYINDTYKETFKTFSGLSDSEITAVTFPAEGFNETTATYYVKTADLSATKKDDNYVKVMADGESKYVNKKNFPYVLVKENNNYFYVSAADLQLLKSSSGASNGNKGVRMVDPSDGDKDIYANPESIDQYGDSWKIDRPTYKSGYYNAWKKDKVEYGEGNAYFILKAEVTNDPKVIAQYQQIDGDKYIRKGEKLYYTKVNNNENFPENYNYIIVDENGNMLTKPLTTPEVFAAETQSDNEDLEDEATSYFGTNATLSSYWNEYTRAPKDPEEIPGDKGRVNNGQYVGNSSYRVDQDYRIPALERVYFESTFNLSADSFYSYFDIDDLWRINYTYMNVNEFNHTVNGETITEGELWKVDDMFFTTTRAKWID